MPEEGLKASGLVKLRMMSNLRKKWVSEPIGE
jgi:hypothetical protein